MGAGLVRAEVAAPCYDQAVRTIFIGKPINAADLWSACFGTMRWSSRQGRPVSRFPLPFQPPLSCTSLARHPVGVSPHDQFNGPGIRVCHQQWRLPACAVVDGYFAPLISAMKRFTLAGGDVDLFCLGPRTLQ
jgi:hypothetical protein